MTAYHPEPNPRHRVRVRFYPLAKNEQEAQRRQHHRHEDDAERGPGCSRRVGSRAKLLLNDLKLGFDRGGSGACLIRVTGLTG